MRPRISSNREPAFGQDGSAALEFIVAGMVLLVPIVYMIVALGQIQSHAFGVETAARQAARVIATSTDSQTADAATRRIMAAVAIEYGIDPGDVELVATGEAALWAGIAALAGADRLGVVGDAVEDVVDDAHTAGRNGGVRFGVVEDYVGHGIGSAMHQPPDVLNYRTRDRGAKVRPGLCVAVEPMIVRGDQATRVLADDWTVVTEDGSRASHWEHTVAILETGIWVLTARDGGAAGLAPHGVVPTPLA